MKVLILVRELEDKFESSFGKTPKSMAEINGKPFLEFKIESLKKQGIKDIIFCVGNSSSVIEDYFGNGKRFGVNLNYSYEKKELLGTAGAIKNAGHLINEDFIAMNGDTYLDVNIKKLLDFHKNHNFPITIVVCDASHVKNQELIRLNGCKIENIYERGTIEHESYLNSVSNALVNGGLYVINKDFLKKIPDFKKVSLEKEIFPKYKTEIKAFLHKGYMLDIYDEGDWKELKQDVKQGLIMPSLTGYQKIIRSRAPIRITFGGGGTDISPYDKKYNGICVNATINRYVYCSLKIRDDLKINIKSDIINIYGGFETYEESFENIDCIKIMEKNKLNIIKAIILEMNPSYGFDIYVRSEVPPHSGLGASASLCVSIIGAFNYLRKKDRLTKHEIAEKAFEIERKKMQNKGGRQDQYATTFGGINLYEFKGGYNVRVNPLNINKDYLFELEKNLLVVSSGRRTKSSGEIHKNEKEQNFFKDNEKIKRLHEIKNTAIDVEFNLRRGNFKKFGKLIFEGWEKKKKFNPSATNIYIDALIEEALRNGAIGAKLMGAGGGGYLLIYCEPNKEHKIREVLDERGAKSIDFSFDFQGLKVWEIEE